MQDFGGGPLTAGSAPVSAELLASGRVGTRSLAAGGATASAGLLASGRVGAWSLAAGGATASAGLLAAAGTVADILGLEGVILGASVWTVRRIRNSFKNASHLGDSLVR